MVEELRPEPAATAVAGAPRSPGPAASVRTGPDLDRRSEIHDLVVRFYREVVFDDLLDPVFSEVAEVDWAVHIPRLIDYWCQVVLGQPGYEGALLASHRHVHERAALRAEHLDRWFELWVQCIDEGWAGPGAERAKRHAARTAGTLARHLLGAPWAPPDSGRPASPAAPVRHTGPVTGSDRGRR